MESVTPQKPKISAVVFFLGFFAVLAIVMSLVALSESKKRKESEQTKETEETEAEKYFRRKNSEEFWEDQRKEHVRRVLRQIGVDPRD